MADSDRWARHDKQPLDQPTRPQTIDRDALSKVLRDRSSQHVREQVIAEATDAVLALLRPVEGVVLTPDEIDVIAPALLEAGTRHLEQRGTAWHELGRRVHAIAERLYAATLNRQEHP